MGLNGELGIGLVRGRILIHSEIQRVLYLSGFLMVSSSWTRGGRVKDENFREYAGND